MIKALAPGMRRGCSWVWLSIVMAGGFSPAVLAQVAKDAATARKNGSAPKAEAAKDKEPGAPRKNAAATDGKPAAEGDDAPEPDEPEGPKASSVEVFKDPRAEAALKVFKGIPGLRPFPERDVRSVLAQAEGGPADRELLQRFVSGMTLVLSDKNNINAVINPPAGARPNDSTRALQRATDHLLDVYNTARRSKNAGFLTTYSDVLVDTLPKLLDGNLLSRIQAMIVLGQIGSPKAVPVFLAQLKDPKQTVWVKHLAARGLSSLVENGVKIDAMNVQPIEVAKTIADLLEREKDLPWPVQMRLLEALGAMRVASMPNGQKAEMATAAMNLLADDETHPEVRAQAAWALGMFRVSAAVRDYNYALVSYYTGRVAADLGEEIEDAVAQNRLLAEYLSGVLIGPLHQAFNGLDNARESGLLKVPGGNPNMGYSRQIADLSSAVSRAAVELARGPVGKIPDNRKSLANHVTALKSFLYKNPPKNFRLVPGGREFPPANPQVAKARPDNEGVAGGPGR